MLNEMIMEAYTDWWGEERKQAELENEWDEPGEDAPTQYPEYQMPF